MRTDLFRLGRPGVLLAGVAGLAVVVSGCGSTGSSIPGPTASIVGAAAVAPTPTAAASSPTTAAVRPPDPVVTSVAPVARPGVAATAARVSAGSAQPFDKTVTYADGVTVTVTKIVNSVSVGQGPGVFDGAPQTTLWIRITNGSHHELDVSRVVLTMTYGTPAHQAQPVYGGSAMDFSGTLTPGASGTGVYAFAVPTDQRGAARLAVDIDGGHTVGLFTGSVA